ncbi:MAG: hypothetical protein ACLGIR_12305 [Actinomycetes bacterium]
MSAGERPERGRVGTPVDTERLPDLLRRDVAGATRVVRGVVDGLVGVRRSIPRTPPAPGRIVRAYAPSTTRAAEVWSVLSLRDRRALAEHALRGSRGRDAGAAAVLVDLAAQALALMGIDDPLEELDVVPLGIAVVAPYLAASNLQLTLERNARLLAHLGLADWMPDTVRLQAADPPPAGPTG